jgi:hypothetical protein
LAGGKQPGGNRYHLTRSPIEAIPRAAQRCAILAGLFLVDVGVLSLVTNGPSFTRGIPLTS